MVPPNRILFIRGIVGRGGRIDDGIDEGAEARHRHQDLRHTITAECEGLLIEVDLILNRDRPCRGEGVRRRCRHLVNTTTSQYIPKWKLAARADLSSGSRVGFDRSSDSSELENPKKKKKLIHKEPITG